MGVLKYELLLLLASIIWGAAFVAQQIGMERGLGPMTFNALRFALGCLSLVPVLLWRRRGREIASKPTKLPIAASVWAGLFLFAAASLQQIGLQYTSSANAGFITGFYILFVPVLGLFFGHRARVSLWGGIAVSLVGLYLLSVTGDFVCRGAIKRRQVCAIKRRIMIESLVPNAGPCSLSGCFSGG